MSIIEKAIHELLESDEKYPTYGHDIKLFPEGKTKICIFPSSGISNEYPYLFVEIKNLSKEQEEKLRKIKLDFSKESYFRNFESIRLVA